VGDAGHSLAVTGRCLTEDLGLPNEACKAAVEDLRTAHELIDCFVEKRRSSTSGQEVIRTLAPTLIAYSLHCGRWRGASWFHEDLGVVWLLAMAIHRDDSREDAYEVFGELQARRRLMPTEADVRNELARRSRDWAQSLVSDLRSARQIALDHPNDVHQFELGGRVQIRLVYEPGDPPLLAVAISQRLRPGGIRVPPSWFVQLLAALYPTTAFDDLSYVDELSPGIPLSEDETGFCDFYTY
jgi:hypothetical protein